MKLLKNNDFDCVGMIAKHCDLSKVCIAENEALTFDLNNLFCDYWEEIISIWNEVDKYLLTNDENDKPDNYEQKHNLIYGGQFLSCSNKKTRHLGIKRILVYYSYSRYLFINGFNDTPNGVVQKTNDFSIPKPLKEIKDFADKYRSMGYDSYKKTLEFMCHNREVFTGFNSKECSKCSCECSSCKGSTRNKGFGIKSSIIKR